MPPTSASPPRPWRCGSSTRLVALATELCGAPTLPGAEGGRVAAIAPAAAQLLFIGRYELTDSLLSGIDPGGGRQSFLTNVPDNARTMALARKRLGQSL